MSIPLKDTLLAAYATSFDRHLTDEGQTYRVGAEEAAAFSALRRAFTDAMDALAASRAAGVWSRPMTAGKGTAKAALAAALRGHYAAIAGDPTIDPAAKAAIGVHVRKRGKTPTAAPDARPAVTVASVVGRTIYLSIRDEAGPHRAGKPANATHAYVFAAHAPHAVGDPSRWQFHGEATTGRHAITLPDDVPGGARVLVCAAWVSARGARGPMSEPVHTNLQGGAALPALSATRRAAA